MDGRKRPACFLQGHAHTFPTRVVTSSTQLPAAVTSMHHVGQALLLSAFARVGS